MICENCHCQKTKKLFFFSSCVKIMVCLVAEKMEIKKKEAQFRCYLLNCLYFNCSYTFFFIFFFMGRARLNLVILFLG